MTVYLVADKDADYTYSAYAFKVSNYPVQVYKHEGWTVVEAYLHGIIAASDFIISHGLVKSLVVGIDLCTSSNHVIKALTTPYLETLFNNGWKNSDGSYLFHSNLLKSLYYHYIYYTERDLIWHVLSEVGEMDYTLYLQCKEQLKNKLEAGL